MTLLLEAPFVVPYGTARVRSDLLGANLAARGEPLSRPGCPVVEIDPRRPTPLRLTSVEHPFTRPPMAQDLAHADSQLAFLESHLVRLSGDFSKTLQRFVLGYFAAVGAQVDREIEALEARTRGLEGLIERDHWAFTALLPLPRAHVPVSVGARSEFASCDVAFWTGSELVACFLEQEAPQFGLRKRSAEAIAAAGGCVVRIDPAALFPEQDEIALLERLGPAFRNFLDGVALPSSPFRGTGISDPQIR